MCSTFDLFHSSFRSLSRRIIRLSALLLIALFGTVSGQTTIFSESFEDSFPETWSVGDLDADSGLDYWGTVTCRKYSGSYSAWCAKVGATKETLCNDYALSMQAYMDSPVIPLSFPDGSPMYTDVVLSFWSWVELNGVPPYPNDYLAVYYRESGGGWQLLATAQADVYDWMKRSWSMGSLDDIQLRFMFFSYNSPARPAMEGVYVDDILITGCPVLTGPAPVYPLLKDPVCGDQPATYSWTAVSNATSYTIAWYDGNPLVAPPLYTETADSATFTKVLPGSGTRYWRVRAEGPCGSGPWSSTVQIYLFPTPSQVTLLAPANGSDVCPGLVQRYSWTPAADATSYRVQFDQSSSFLKPIEHVVTTTYLDRTLSSTGVWYWRVRGETSHCTGNWSATGHFTVPAPLTAPTLTAPVSGDLKCPADNPFTFSWEAVDDAIGYYIECDTDPSFASPPLHSYTSASETSAALTLSEGSTWYWRVRALGSCENGPWSETRDLFVWYIPSNVILMSPGDGAILCRDHPFNFRWVGAEPLIVFNIQWDDDSGFASPEQEYTTTNHISWTPPQNGVWHWRVRPETGCGVGTWSSRSFTVQDVFESMVINSFSAQPNGTIQLGWQDPGLLFNYSVVYRTNILSGADWIPVPPSEQWPITATNWSGSLPVTVTPVYLKIQCD